MLAESPAAAAQDVAVAQARTEPAMRIEVNTSTLPRIDPQDNGFKAPRVDMTLSPDKQGLGVVLGMSGFGSRVGVQPAALAAPGPSMDLGLRWRQLVQSKQVDVTAWRRMSNDADAYTLIQQSQQPVYGARVEMKIDEGRKSGFTAASNFLGFQMESGARISVRRSDGRPMVYYRQAF
ncbi:hypothetical protein HHL11_17250 [Ramlibacter sp. G-1-2-2]|uniref:Uncharacterized protein n=1 Tax=Ramlibacter agri TaxID=2728837 RepID=A0A848HAL5_9BURK|nr:hypothetical protein [Ramlibacter agri]NML45503.1 hypothetical protein [Ramlibacter agri]